MPAISKKKKPQIEASEILYPTLVVKHAYAGATGPDAMGPLDEAAMTKLLKYQTEAEWAAMMKEKDPSIQGEPTFASAVPPIDPIGEDVEGNLFVCWNNLVNRPFDRETALKYAQDILKGQWAGPTAFPGETVNGETMIVSRTGQVRSAQHRGIGYKFACQMYRKDPLRWNKFNAKAPVFESLIVFGTSDDDRIVQTIDNVRPHTETDLFFTSPLFAGKGRQEKLELSRYLSRAVDLLWVRTGAAGNGDKNYKSHSEVKAFLDAHPKLIDCVKHVFEENSGEKGRPISLLKLSAGQIAALMYLMGSSASDPVKYRKAKPGSRSEKGLDWSMWDKASEFVVMLANQGTEDAICKALTRLVDDEEGTGGRLNEKFAVLGKAWQVFSQGKEPTEDECRPMNSDYTKDEKTGQYHLTELSNFGGIDLGDKAPKVNKEEEVDPEEAKKAARKIKAEGLAAKLKSLRQPKVKAGSEEAKADANGEMPEEAATE